MQDWTVHPCASAARDAMTRWQLRAPRHVATTPTGLILHVLQPDGGPAILKCLTETGARAETHAAAALRHWNGKGAVSVYASTADTLLMAFCSGPTLHAAPDLQSDETAIPILCDVAQDLHSQSRPASGSFPTLADRCSVLARIAAKTSADQWLFDTAAALAGDLIKTTPETHLLHGDFHHENVLATGSGTWCAIDPQPLIGDRAYDFANTFGNPIDNPERVLSPGRPQHLSETMAKRCNLSADRLRAWAFVHACIAGAWSIEDNRDPGLRLALARTLAPDT